MNEENLKPFTSDQNREEAVKNGSKGGQASGEARRKKRDIRKAVENIFDVKRADKDGNMLDGYEEMAVALRKMATDPKNRQAIAAQKYVRELLGLDQSPEDKERVKNNIKLQQLEIEKTKKQIEKMDEDWI